MRIAIWPVLVLAIGNLMAMPSSAWADTSVSTVPVGVFTREAQVPPQPWQVVRFAVDVPPTHYRINRWDGAMAIEAVADASMALLARSLDVDLAATPVLCWHWRVDAPLKSADMAQKPGDDYAARVYVAFDLPDDAMDWRTRLQLGLAHRLFGAQAPDAALSYVWDNRYPVGTERPNAYTERTHMRVLQSGASNAGQWIIERRNVLTDAEQAFGRQGFKARLLAVASDTDNTGEQARAGFADLHFVGADTVCDFPPLNH
ncbi:DUF3047 domain-containing protein [Porticoccus sp.]